MSEWKEYRLGEVSTVQTGPFGSQLHQSDYKLIGTPIVTVEHLGENKILHQDLPLVSDEDKERLNKYVLEEGDIVFSRVGSVDRRAYVSKNEDGWMFSGRCLRVRVNKEIVDPKYLSYYFGQESFKEHIRMIAVGATMPSINTEILSGVSLNLPDLPEQHSIASILSSLDDKIDLLHRQNKTLEALAQTLFRQWFVEEAEGLETKTLDELIIFDPREKISNNTEYSFFDMKCLSESSMMTTEGIKRTINSGSSFRNGDTLLAKITPCLENGKTAFVTNLEENEIARGSTEFIVMRAKNGVSPYFVYCLARYVDFRNTAILSMTGTSGRQRVQTSVLKNYEIKYSKELIGQFHQLCHHNFIKIKQNQIQIRTLIRLRDTLLPKLMSGEVRIGVEELKYEN